MRAAARPSPVLRGAVPLRVAAPAARAAKAARATRCVPLLAARLDAMDAAVEAAEELHRQAAQLNKEGRFDEATAMYARYAAALSAADAAAQKDDAACLARLQAAAASAAVLRPSRLAAAVRARALGAVVGAACADAASMSTHWVYDVAALNAMVAASVGRDAAFLDPPADAFYKYPLGSPSPYGQQAAALLHSLVETGGFSPEAYAACTFATFGAPAFTAGGGYLDGSTKGFLRAVRAGAGWPDCGVPDDQANAVARLPPLVAAYAGDPQLLPAVEQMVCVTQNSDIAVAWGTAAARVLEAVILGATPADAVGLAIRQLRDPARARPGELDAQVADAMDAAVALAGATHADAVTQLGRNCHLPGSAQSPMHATLTTTRRDDGAGAYQAAVLDTILQGGCNASRAGFVGACFGAAHGVEAVPAAWRAKFSLYALTLERAEALLALRADARSV